MREYIARECMRFDTAVARAFRIALGLPAGFGRREGASTLRDRMGGIPELFANREHVNF